MGKIKDNSQNKIPLVIFDTGKFAAFEKKTKTSKFMKLPLFDIDNLVYKVPKDFKAVFIGENTYLITGGQEREIEPKATGALCRGSDG